MMTGSIIKQTNTRKRFTAEQKMTLVQATFEPGARVVEVARKYNIGVSTLIKWRKNSIEGSLMSVKDNAPAVPTSEVKN